MRVQASSPAFVAIVCLLAISFPARAQGFEFTGQILTSTVARRQVPRFNIKLYPPKTSGKPILITTSDALRRFKFTGLSADTYLLEIYLGKDLVYQEVINLNGTLDLKIDLRKK
jgi:hypothetical protein